MSPQQLMNEGHVKCLLHGARSAQCLLVDIRLGAVLAGYGNPALYGGGPIP